MQSIFINCFRKSVKQIADQNITYLLILITTFNYSSDISPFLSILGSIIIILFIKWRRPESWMSYLGLEFKKRDYLLICLLLPIMMGLSQVIVTYISESNGIFFQKPYIIAWILHPLQAHTLGQTFNEEMILGAYVLFALRDRLPRFHPLLISAITALFFSIVHLVFYSYLSVFSDTGHTLSYSTLFSLLIISFLKNNLILIMKNISLSWTIHLGFNLIFLGGFYYRNEDFSYLSEPEIFNMIISSPLFIVIGIVGSLLSGSVLLCFQPGDSE